MSDAPSTLAPAPVATPAPGLRRVAVPFTLGTRTTHTFELIDDTNGIVLVDETGRTVSLEIRSIEDPAVTRERTYWNAALHAYRTLPADAPARVRADAEFELEEALAALLVALVVSWSYPTISCTPDAVRAFFARAPFAPTLVMERSSDLARFFPESLTPSLPSSAPTSEAAA